MRDKIVQHNEMSSALSEVRAGGRNVYPDLNWYASEIKRKGLHRGRCTHETQTCECGLKYVPAEPENNALHTMQHNEYLNGPELTELSILESIASVDIYPLFVADATVLEIFRQGLSEIASVEQRETRVFKKAYSGFIPEGSDTRLYVLADGDRGIAMVVTALDENYYWRLSFSHEGKVIKFPDQSNHLVKRQKIERIWVAKNYRGRGLGAKLAKAVLSSLSCDMADIGWELPLTMDGKNLVRKLTPLQWWGRGDCHALQYTLELP